MKMRNHKMFGSLILCIFLAGIASCGKQDNSTTAVQPVSATSGANAQQQADLKIVAYGPEGTDAAKSFNMQPSGDSALWVRLDRAALGSDAAIWWGDQRLDSSASGNTITALVPAKLYASAGKYALQVRANDGSSSSGTKSDIVYFTVK